MKKPLALIAVAIVVIVAVWATRPADRSEREATPSASPVDRAVPAPRHAYSAEAPAPQRSLQGNDDVDEASAQPSPTRDPLLDNPIAEITSRGLDAATEREELLMAMTNSGSAGGDWVHRARDRMAEVEEYLSQQDLGDATDLGCYAAGCAVRVTFRDAKAARNPETLTNPMRTGRWPNGVIITEPKRLDPSSEQHVSWVFFLGPPSP